MDQIATDLAALDIVQAHTASGSTWPSVNALTWVRGKSERCVGSHEFASHLHMQAQLCSSQIKDLKPELEMAGVSEATRIPALPALLIMDKL